jgi:hypothetical protein
LNIIEWLQRSYEQHPALFAAAATWIANYGVSNFVSALPAPTKDSGQFYKFVFRFGNNWLAQNTSRANGVRVEASPNWQDALIAKARDEATIQGATTNAPKKVP